MKIDCGQKKNSSCCWRKEITQGPGQFPGGPLGRGPAQHIHVFCLANIPLGSLLAVKRGRNLEEQTSRLPEDGTFGVLHCEVHIATKE